MQLNEILEIVKEKYSDAVINTYECGNDYIQFQGKTIIYRMKIDNKGRICIYTSKYVEFENNVIELKHRLGIDITWDNLIKLALCYSVENTCLDIIVYDEYIYLSGLGISFVKDNIIKTDNGCIKNRTYYNMYSIINNLK